MDHHPLRMAALYQATKDLISRYSHQTTICNKILECQDHRRKVCQYKANIRQDQMCQGLMPKLLQWGHQPQECKMAALIMQTMLIPISMVMALMVIIHPTPTNRKIHKTSRALMVKGVDIVA